MTALLTYAQKSALLWLRNRNGDGVFDRNQVLVAAGERGPYNRSTWSELERAGFVERYHERRRLRVTPSGLSVDVHKITENEPCDLDGVT